jgi:hypothetical protein
MQNDDVVTWSLVADISQGLQISFASIKAAISSLLGGDIFWDQATQHEFMQTIDSSVDDLSNLTAVMTVAMRSANRTLTIHREPNSLQEILSQACDQVQKAHPDANIMLTLPAETRMGLVDFEYLRMALRLLIEVLISTRDNPRAPLLIQVAQDDDGWRLMFMGAFSGAAQDIIDWFCYNAPESAALPALIRAETKLKVLTAYQLFALHAIRVSTNSQEDGEAGLIFFVPFALEA